MTYYGAEAGPTDRHASQTSYHSARQLQTNKFGTTTEYCTDHVMRIANVMVKLATDSNSHGLTAYDSAYNKAKVGGRNGAEM